MGKVANEIKKIQVKENLTLPEVFQKYPHLASLQFKELQEEDNLIEEGPSDLVQAVIPNRKNIINNFSILIVYFSLT